MKKELKDQMKQDELTSGLEQAMAWAMQQPRPDPHRRRWCSWCWRAPCWRSRTSATSGCGRRTGRYARRSPPSRRPWRPSWRPAASGRRARCSRPRKRSTRPPRPPSRASSAATRPRAAGLRAKYFAALSRLELGQYAEAEKSLKEIQARGAGLEPDLARLALASLYRRSGQVDKAVEAYRAFATNPSASLPRDHALMSAAQTLEDARRFPEAPATYRQLTEEFPASVFASAARARAEYLATAG